MRWEDDIKKDTKNKLKAEKTKTKRKEKNKRNLILFQTRRKI